MELGIKEKQVILVALRRFLRELEDQLNSGNVDEEESADLANDAALVDLLVSRFEKEA
ncbi:hypothetical protein [Dyella acidisoli]|uniref:Uncharacterized protein n=1 Tax=Dyella acidisoli TaxID=1867834 RepID=A0ABQ5XUI0_9GAMM|nr:hypothetical protein [Dyella acidisoli]GLQ94080.1 hypothetical protein GCM10007901_30310 [Dyella acidisoli]